jgi:hypothetical protein
MSLLYLAGMYPLSFGEASTRSYHHRMPIRIFAAVGGFHRWTNPSGAIEPAKWAGRQAATQQYNCRSTSPALSATLTAPPLRCYGLRKDLGDVKASYALRSLLPLHFHQIRAYLRVFSIAPSRRVFLYVFLVLLPSKNVKRRHV